MPEASRREWSDLSHLLDPEAYRAYRRDLNVLVARGVRGIRLAKDDREAFIECFGTRLAVLHGATLKEYVAVPEAVVGDTHEVPLNWRKSGRCDSASCVEVAVTRGRVGVRDGKDPNGAVLWFTPEEWTAFMAGVRDGALRDGCWQANRGGLRHPAPRRPSGA